MASLQVACFLYLFIILEISVAKSEDIASIHEHELPYWIQDSLFEYADETGDRNVTGPIRKIYRKDLNPNYVAYYEFQFEDVCITFSAGPKTGDHRLVEEQQVPRTTDTLIAQAAKINKVCHKFFRINADGTTICEDDTGKVVASTMDFRTFTTNINMTVLTQEVSEGLLDFEEEWKRLAKKIRLSYEWKEMSIYSMNKTPPGDQIRTIFKVLTPGESQNIPIGTSDLSKVKIKAHVHESFSDSKKILPTLCLLLGNICSERGEVNISSILRKKKNLNNLNYITIDVTDDYESLVKQLKKTSIDFYLQLAVSKKFVVIRRYTIRFTHRRDKRSSWSSFTTYPIPYESLMPNYNQHQCCGGCWSGCVPVAWAQVFAYYDRVAHTHGYRYSTKHWRGNYGVYGDPSKKAPGNLNTEVKSYVEALRVPLRTFCSNGGGSTYNSDTNKVDGWFRQRQGTGRVITLSLSNVNQQVSLYIKKGYPVVNNFWYSKKSGSGHSVVVTKIKEKYHQYKSCKTVGWWWGRKTKCWWKKQYEYEWYRRMGWGGSQNGWYPPAAYGAFVAVV